MIEHVVMVQDPDGSWYVEKPWPTRRQACAHVARLRAKGYAVQIRRQLGAAAGDVEIPGCAS